MKKHGGFIAGIRPGKNTAEYLDYVITRLTVLGQKGFFRDLQDIGNFKNRVHGDASVQNPISQ